MPFYPICSGAAASAPTTQPQPRERRNRSSATVLRAALLLLPLTLTCCAGSATTPTEAPASVRAAMCRQLVLPAYDPADDDQTADEVRRQPRGSMLVTHLRNEIGLRDQIRALCG